MKEEAERQLNDTRFYEVLDHDPTEEFSRRVSVALQAMLNEKFISEDNMDYLTVQNPKAGRFYLLPKIHKTGNPGRPIVSANGHPTERISEFIDLHLRPHVSSLPSYVQDTTDYLRKIDSQVVPDNTLLVSMDVTSLYTNIPHEDGISACKEAWDSRYYKDPPTETLVELLSLVLRCNNFTFNEKHYLQIQGTAMGTKMAPSYANIFMGRLEKQLLSAVPMKPHLWLRFIDDVDMQWCHGQENLTEFLDMANNFHPSIKFTSEVSNYKHVFLDTVSKLEENKIVVDLYSKPTDTHQYLLPTSCHPKHCSRNIPYSQALRIRRICTNTDTFDKRADELFAHLQRRGYHNDSVSGAIMKARALKRDDLLKPVTKGTSTNQRLPFVVTYHPNLLNIRATRDKHWSIIEKSDKLTRIFPEKPLVAYRRPKSLRDILVRAIIRPSTETHNEGRSAPCGTSRCKTCAHMTPTNTLLSSNKAQSYIKGISNCKTSNAIYLMTCKKCEKKYVEETNLTIALRMNLHRSDWSNERFFRSPVAEHFKREGHTFSDIELCCIEFNNSWTDAQRKARETYWIRRLNTLKPSGINKSE